MTFASMQEEFDALNVQLIGLSIDSLHSHIAWLRRLNELEWKDIKKPEVKFPLIDDVSMEVSHKYGMVHPATGSSTSAVRAVFIIDDKGIVRTILYYPASTGRNFEEIKRIVIALQKADKENIATPADWKPGDDVILPAPGTCGAAKDAMATQDEDKYCLDWFLCFRKEK